jgi:MFS family permease
MTINTSRDVLPSILSLHLEAAMVERPLVEEAAVVGGAKDRWLALFGDGRVAVSIMIMGGVAMHALSLRVVATVLPSVVADIGGLRFFAWTTTVAVVSAIWGAALAASLAELRGLRGAYRLSLLLFAAGSSACALAPDMAVFLAGRLFQGLGGGLLTALAYTAIRRVFPVALRTRAIVMISGIWGVGALSGPLLGGVLAGWGVWRWAFWVDVPAGAALVLLTRCALPGSAEAGVLGHVPRVGSAIGRLALLGASVLAVATGGVSGHAVASVLGLILGAALLIVLLRLERNGAGPLRLLPSDAYRPRSVLGAVSLVMALMAGCTTAVLYVPYVAVAIGGYPPIAGGYLSAVVAVSWTVAAFASASAGGEWAARSILGGAALLALGMLLAAWALSARSFVAMGLALVPVGGGIGVAWAHLGNLMMTRARPAEHDVSSAFISTNQLIAQAFASALGGSVANVAGFADPALGPAGVVRAVVSVFMSFTMIAVAGFAASLIVVRLSTARP